MTREEIVNSQDYKATKAAIEWWYSLPEEQRKATDIDAEPDIVDAYSEGVIYGWNNPQWIPVEEELPEVGEKVIFYSLGLDDWMAGAIQSDGRWWSDEYASHFTDVTIWMMPQPPQGKEE